MGTISRFETVNGALRPAAAEVSQTETKRARRPWEPDEAADKLAAKRACAGVLEHLPLAAKGSVIASLMAQFLVRWPESSRGEILRALNAEASTALEFLSAPPPDGAA